VWLLLIQAAALEVQATTASLRDTLLACGALLRRMVLLANLLQILVKLLLVVVMFTMVVLLVVLSVLQLVVVLMLVVEVVVVPSTLTLRLQELKPLPPPQRRQELLLERLATKVAVIAPLAQASEDHLFAPHRRRH
jgi:hypothetical protein